MLVLLSNVKDIRTYVESDPAPEGGREFTARRIELPQRVCVCSSALQRVALMPPLL